ncbi:MAG TPA: PEGA domain-containing protein [Kofleriaceae bacterium]
MRAVAVLIALVCGLDAAYAEDKPWAEGVPADAQSAALELYRQGNEMFEQARYLEALAKYEVALRSWDHPSIRYNAAVCLINLGRAEEAYENLMAALRFDGAPLSAELQRQARTYESLLAGQLAELEVQCKEPNAKVQLDGKDLLDCPGAQARKLKPGRHQVVAQKPGYETESRAIELAAGKKTTLVLELKVVGSRGRLERRWPRWLPITVLATGAAFGVAAVPLSLAARSDRDAWDEQFRAYCPGGCDPASLDQTQRARLDELESTRSRSATFAYTAMAVGAVGLGVGFALVLLNQPRLVGATVTPQVGRDHASLSVVGRW